MAEQALYVVGVDGSEPSRRALHHAADLAHRTGAGLLLVHAVNWSGYTPLAVQEAAQRPLDKKEEERVARDVVLTPLAEEARKAGVEVDIHFGWGHPSKFVIETAKKRDAQMIVIGRRGHSNLAELVLGSVSNAIAHHADIPVLLVP